MSEHVFYQRGRNKGNERQVVLRSATLLVGEAPTKQKRIRMKVSMPLTGRRMTGTPEWVMNAMTFVNQSHDIVSPVVEFKGFDIHFDDEQLFEAKGAKANKCHLRSFVIQEVGESENPDVDMQFLIYAPFSTTLWKWCGQLAGEEFWGRFDQVDDPNDRADLELTGDDDEEEGEEEEPES